MKSHALRLLGFTLLFVGCGLWLRASNEPPPLPPLEPSLDALGPIKLIEAATTPGFTSDLDEGKVATITAQGPATAGDLVYRLDNPARHRNHYAVQASWKISYPVKKGSSLLLRFYARTLFAKQEAGEATFGIYFQQSASPWHKSIQTQLSIGKDWKLIEIPFTCAGDYGPGEAGACFSFAYLAQSLEMTAPVVLDFEDRIGVEALPRTRFTYGGREADAPWRAAALERIEKLRTAPFSITVHDAAGHPVPGAQVKAFMTRPEFVFGSEIDTAWIVKTTKDAERYRQLSLELFETLTPGNGLKWPRWIQPTAGPGRAWTRDQTLKALEWLYAQDVRIKGHVLVWGGWDFTPRSVREMPDQAERHRRLPELIDGFMTQVTTATKGRIAIWDVLNEPLNEPAYIDLLGENAAANWFKRARVLAPHAKLFINEYRMLSGGESRETINRYLALVSRLRALGAPIDGLGIQGHFGQQMPTMDTILADMDVLATSGLPVQITEFDINTKDEELQADFTRDFLIACYSHPACTGFINWGFWEGTHWLPAGAMYRKDWTIKPNGQIWRDLVLGQWRTKLDQPADANGRVSARGHRGRYRVEVTASGRTTTQIFDLTGTGAEVVVKLN